MTTPRPTRIVRNQQGKITFVEVNGRWMATTTDSTVESYEFDPRRRNGDQEVNFYVRREQWKIEVVPPQG